MNLLSLARRRLSGPFPGPCRIYNLTGSSAALLLSLDEKPYIAFEEDEARAVLLRQDINFFRSVFGGGHVLFLPDPNGPEASGERARLIYSRGAGESIVTSLKNLSAPLWSEASLSDLIIEIRRGGIMSRPELEEALVSMEYVKAPMVAEKGQFSRREWIIDVFPSTMEDPLRIEFFGDEVESIRSFDIETQRSKSDIEEFLLFPAGDAGIEDAPSLLTKDRRCYSLVPADGNEGLPENTLFLSRYSFLSDGPSETTAAPEQLDAGVRSLKGYGILPEERRGIQELSAGIARVSRENRVIIVASSSGQSERLRDLFREEDLIVPVAAAADLAGSEERILITVGGLSAGLFLDGLVILTERELFGERSVHRPLKRSKLANLLLSLDDIAAGDFVVHRDHGIGRFAGVVRQKRDDAELELMTIEYDDGRLYVPVQNIRTISKYRAEEGFVPKVDRIGGKTWQRRKDRARKKIHDMAERLLSLYAGRRSARGFTFSPDTELHREFDSFFSYEETPDQLKAIADIKRDMESDRPMERLLCGDVGYGKTEVAMRAAFKTVYDHRQVAVLVPTTILAEQHYRTFRERFSGFPVSIDFISRFKSAKENAATLKALAAGEIDIIIGTHGLLAKKVVFNRLGLLIVDEEHRFGVGQKEKIKELSRTIDVLTLTATPIPRTLHMALSGIREMSVIETPPEERLAVRSVVTTFNDAVIQDAIRRELSRSGQVFFVHNRVQDIHKIAGKAQALAPEAVLAVGHGQMPERELETVMHRFFRGEVNVLVSTAIVGAGLDIPRANTIIITMADRMGLADLYQLRGRVGRSTAKGYAYFLAPPESALTDEAKKRLQAVQEMSYLGAGFRLALKDLEIRGAGDVFGHEQSGHVHEVGFDLYMEMLEQAVAELKGEVVAEEWEPVIEIRTAAYIPESYIGDVTLRLSFYRRIAALRTEKEIADFRSEIRDRFGGLPEEVSNLLDVVTLKIICRSIFATKLKETKGRVQVLFSTDTPVQPSQILALGRNKRRMIRFLQDGFELMIRDPDRKEVFASLRDVLQELRCAAGAASG
ncbi:MAG: transcription-repair coupling factor [Nitrospiraceae bacterium]|nr:transcription-repair coupling factor [Nitrospiraceae bacterium]